MTRLSILLLSALLLVGCYVERECETVNVVYKDGITKINDEVVCNNAIDEYTPPSYQDIGTGSGAMTSSGKVLVHNCQRFILDGEISINCAFEDPCKETYYNREQRICADAFNALMHDKDFADSVLRVEP